MPAPTPKSDQRKALQEAAYKRWLAGKAKASVKAVVAPLLASAPRVDNVPVSNNAATRQAKWRKANPDLHRERSRASMRKLRAQAKD